MLVDPYTFPIEPLLAQIATDHPGLPVIGGLASAGGGPGLAALLSDGEVVREGAVGVTLAGVDVRPCVSQGARPIGPEMVITAAEGNVVHELASQPALERLKQAILELDPHDRALATQGLLLGIVVDENKPDYRRGDFLVRGLLGVDEESESISVGERVRVGQTIRMQVRDGASADEDLRETLARELRRAGRAAGGRPPLHLQRTGIAHVRGAGPRRVAARARITGRARRRVLLRRRDRTGRGSQLRARLHRDAGAVRVLSDVAPEGVVRVTAPNPSPMTLDGTNSYVVDGWVVDPGPADAGHLDAVLDAAGGAVKGVVLTHDHRDHSEGAPALVGARRRRVRWSARAEGERVGPFEVVATPGALPGQRLPGARRSLLHRATRSSGRAASSSRRAAGRSPPTSNRSGR